MERKLKQLFDYQLFQGNARLSSLIADTESRYMEELTDDAISLVSAAGDRDSAYTNAPKENTHV